MSDQSSATAKKQGFPVFLKVFRKEVGSKSSFNYLKICHFVLRGWVTLHYSAEIIFKKSQHSLWSPSHLESTFFLNTLVFLWREILFFCSQSSSIIWVWKVDFCQKKARNLKCTHTNDSYPAVPNKIPGRYYYFSMISLLGDPY